MRYFLKIPAISGLKKVRGHQSDFSKNEFRPIGKRSLD
jgi:hypothetical protein